MYEGPGVSSIPSGTGGALEKTKNPSNPEYRDLAVSVLFVAQVIVVIGLAFSYGIEALESHFSNTITLITNNSEIQSNEGASNTAKLVGGIFTILFLGTFLSSLLAYAVAKMASKYVAWILKYLLVIRIHV